MGAIHVSKLAEIKGNSLHGGLFNITVLYSCLKAGQDSIYIPNHLYRLLRRAARKSRPLNGSLYKSE